MKYQTGKISIELPEVISAALQVEDMDKEYVGHSINGKPAGKLEKPLEEGQYAFYIGKIFKNNKGVYTEEFLEGVINYARKNLAEGARVKLVHCQILSELFNGEEDLQGTRNFEESKTFIEKIAKNRFDLSSDKLAIVDLAELPEHKAIFALIRNAARTGISLDTAFAQVENIQRGSSLHLAKVLYEASQKSEIFQQMLQSTIPPKLRTGNNGEMANKRNYALIEIAVRLADVLNGCTIHGGIDRQGVYDEIIEKIVKGSKVILTEIPELATICEQLKGKKFETLHLAADKNPYETVSARTKAIRKIAASVLMATSAAIGIFEYGQYREKQEIAAEKEAMTRKIEQDVGERLKGVSYGHRYLDNWSYSITDPVMRENVFKASELTGEVLTRQVLNAAESFGLQLCNETTLPKEFIKSVLTPYIIDFFLANRDLLRDRLTPSEGGGYVERDIVLNKFLEDHRLLLVAHNQENWLFKFNQTAERRELIPLLPYLSSSSHRMRWGDFLFNSKETFLETKSGNRFFRVKSLAVIHLDGRELVVDEVDGIPLVRLPNEDYYSIPLSRQLYHYLWN